MKSTKCHIWKYNKYARVKVGPWLAMLPGKLNVYQFSTWEEAMRFVNTEGAGKQGCRP